MSKDEYLAHYGITGQKWGVRNYENYDGTLTPEGRERYSDDNERAEREKADTKERQNMCVRSNAAHSEFNEKDEYLAHYGVDGMRWGVWNEETAHRYGMGNSSSPSQRPRSEKYDFKEVDGSDKKFKMDKDSGIHMKAGSQISRMQSTAGERKGEAFYAITKQDAGKYRAVNKAQALAAKAGGKSWWGGQYQSNSILKTDLWAPSRETTKTALGEVLKDKNNREAFKNAMTAQKEMERLGIKGHQSKLDKFIVGAKVEKAALTGKADDRLIQRLSNVSGYTMNERIKAANEAAGLGNISVRDELWKNLSKQGYNAIIDYNDKDTGFHTNTPIIVFNRQAVAHVKLGEDVLAKNGINP